jgi:hypothetical protein
MVVQNRWCSSDAEMNAAGQIRVDAEINAAGQM